MVTNPVTARGMTRRDITKAVSCYARRHGFYARTVRTVTVLFRDAIREYRETSPPSGDHDLDCGLECDCEKGVR